MIVVILLGELLKLFKQSYCEAIKNKKGKRFWGKPENFL